LMARLVPFMRKETTEKEAIKKEATEKEAAKKEVVEKEATEKEAAEMERRRPRWRRLRRRRPRWRTTRKTSRPGHRGAVPMMAPSAPSDCPESSISLGVPFASSICIGTRTVYLTTSKTSSWKNCRRPMWSNSIASLTSCSNQ
jgi:hypothetical protein